MHLARDLCSALEEAEDVDSCRVVVGSRAWYGIYRTIIPNVAVALCLLSLMSLLSSGLG